MKIYTRKGDTGETSLFGGIRLRKDAARIEAYGTVDELNAVLGVVAAESDDPVLGDLVLRLQRTLFEVGADLATPRSETNAKVRRITEEDARVLEELIDEAERDLAPLRTFIVPGGTTGAATLHQARTVCRRAERAVVSLAAQEEIGTPLIMYLNRLSDLLFVLARRENHRAGREDIPWTGA